MMKKMVGELGGINNTAGEQQKIEYACGRKQEIT
jgi:hypothetical protein